MEIIEHSSFTFRKNMAISNSNVEFFESINFTVVDNENIIFKLHKLGFVTCVCGQVIQNHECFLINDDKEFKFKFQLCSESECIFCEPTVQWHYERYMEKDGKTYCRKCENELPKENGVCYDCFCKQCYSILNECRCCKFCIGLGQCICNIDDDTVSISD